MKEYFSIFLFSLFLIMSNSVKSQTKILDVWNGKVPGSISDPAYKEHIVYSEAGLPRVANVTVPTIKIFFPPRNKANGTAVLICPGGGYIRLAMKDEGYDVAEWLNTLGITGVVLKYRLPSDSIMKDKSVGPLQDAQEAMRIIRRHAKEWDLNPHKIGVMGFSAGGSVASTLCTHYNRKVYKSDGTSARPDFSVLVYPVISMRKGITHMGSRIQLLGAHPGKKLIDRFSNELLVTKDTPPAFLVQAENDETVPDQNSIDYFLALKKKHISAELHIYEKGGHGFGLARDRGNETESNWTKDCQNWLNMNGYLSAGKNK